MLHNESHRCRNPYVGMYRHDRINSQKSSEPEIYITTLERSVSTFGRTPCQSNVSLPSRKPATSNVSNHNRQPSGINESIDR